MGETENKQVKVDSEVLKIAEILDAGIDQDIFDWCSELAGFDARYYKHSDNYYEHGYYEGNIYIGEWSTTTHEPHGRGIHINDYRIFIGYINNGDGTGKYILTNLNGGFKVGEIIKDANGRRHAKGMRYL